MRVVTSTFADASRNKLDQSTQQNDLLKINPKPRTISTPQTIEDRTNFSLSGKDKTETPPNCFRCTTLI